VTSPNFRRCKMAPQRKQTQATRIPPSVTPSQGIELIQRQIAAGNGLLQGYIDKAPYESWKSTTCSYLDKAFGIGVPNTMKFDEHGEVVLTLTAGINRS
jgi:hypothetical protein